LNQDVAHALVKEWSETVFQTRIRDNVSLAEAPSSGMDIYAYKQACSGSKDYAAFAAEFLARLQGRQA